MDGEFSVYTFFADGQCIRELRFVDVETAMKKVLSVISSVGARFGAVHRVIVTDGGDCIGFEWVSGKGITFPPPPPAEAA